MDSIVFNEDCMAVMARYPDKYFDLACIDPPYGIGEDGLKNHSRGVKSKSKKYKAFFGNDKEPPSINFFSELFRVSKNQIIWGANHFISRIPYDSSCWLVWDKNNGETDFADCELAYTSFNTAVRKFKYTWSCMRQENMKDKEIRIHPTQKPVKLYDWIFKNYATEGMKILDTHLGSGSSRISAHKNKLNFIGCEIDKEYFVAADQRYQDFKKQLTLF